MKKITTIVASILVPSTAASPASQRERGTMIGNITTWLWVREYRAAETRDLHIANSRHGRAALASIKLAILALLHWGRQR